MVLNRRVDVKLARIIMKKFTVLIVAPSFEHDALTYLSEFEKLRVIATGELPEVKAPFWEKRSLSGGFLVQNHDILQVSADDIEIVTERGPTERELQDLLFAFNVSRYVTSNAIVYAKDMATVAISGGQASRIDAARSAIYKANLMGEALEEPQNLLKNSVVASDGFFPFADSLIAMVFTKQRHFRH